MGQNLNVSEIDWEAWEAEEKSRSVRKPPPRDIAKETKKLVKKLLARQFEALNLYEPILAAEEFHQCNTMWRLSSGGNRSGKTLSSAVETARALTGNDPFAKYPPVNGHAVFIGLERKHLVLMYRALFYPGLFQIIEDENTHLWRAVRWDRSNPTQLQEYDESYREKWKDSPPLIPSRLIPPRGISFAEPEVPRLIRFTTGWTSIWLSAEGKPEQGSHVNCAWLDEEMGNVEFYKEVHRGLTRTKETIQQRPKAIWSATSQVTNAELANLRDQAAMDPASDFVREFNFLIANNPYIPADARKSFAQGYSEEDRLTRVEGIPVTAIRRIYPTYNPHGNSEDGSGHGCEPFEFDYNKWTRWVYIDPSISHFAVLFACIDPDDQFLTFYDGFDMGHATSSKAAKEIFDRQHDAKFEGIMIDSRYASQKTLVKDDVTVAKQLWAALEAAGVQVRQQGPFFGFFAGNSEREARIKSLQATMEIRGFAFAGSCRLRVMRGRIPELDKQMRRAITDPKNPTKWNKDPKVPMDFVELAEYAAAHNPCYVPPVPMKVEDQTTKVFHLFQERKKRQQKRQRLEAAHIQRMEREEWVYR